MARPRQHRQEVKKLSVKASEGLWKRLYVCMCVLALVQVPSIFHQRVEYLGLELLRNLLLALLRITSSAAWLGSAPRHIVVPSMAQGWPTAYQSIFGLKDGGARVDLHVFQGLFFLRSNISGHRGEMMGHGSKIMQNVGFYEVFPMFFDEFPRKSVDFPCFELVLAPVSPKTTCCECQVQSKRTR